MMVINTFKHGGQEASFNPPQQTIDAQGCAQATNRTIYRWNRTEAGHGNRFRQPDTALKLVNNWLTNFSKAFRSLYD